MHKILKFLNKIFYIYPIIICIILLFFYLISGFKLYIEPILVKSIATSIFISIFLSSLFKFISSKKINDKKDFIFLGIFLMIFIYIVAIIWIKGEF